MTQIYTSHTHVVDFDDKDSDKSLKIGPVRAWQGDARLWQAGGLSAFRQAVSSRSRIMGWNDDVRKQS